jgi:tetratricopeptide (TPR) repeat protein
MGEVEIEYLNILGLKDGATLSEIQEKYLEKTFQPKFREYFMEDEPLREEFLKYYRAYARLLNTGSWADDPQNDPSFYPPGKAYKFLFNQGLYFFINGEFIKAGEKFQSAFDLHGDDLVVAIYLGLLLLKRRSYYAAEKYFSKVVAKDPQNEDALYFLGISFQKAGNVDKAVEVFNRVKQLNPSRTEVAYRLKELRAGRKESGTREKSGNDPFWRRLFKRAK